MPWVKDPVTGKFVQKTTVVKEAPVNQEKLDYSADACAACHKPIPGRGLKALGKLWHSQCFACSQCNREFEMNAMMYYENPRDGGNAWCLRCLKFDMEKRGEPPGNAESEEIAAAFKAPEKFDNSDPSTTAVYTRVTSAAGLPKFGAAAVGTSSSADPVSLAAALQQSTISGGVSQQQRQQQQSSMAGPSCTGCGKPIQGAAIVLGENQNYHPECFVCADCGQVLNSASFKRHEGRPYHPQCHKLLTAARCGKCGQPCVTKSYNYKGSKYHVGCFKCVICAGSLASGLYARDYGFVCPTCKKENRQPPAVDNAASAAHVRTASNAPVPSMAPPPPPSSSSSSSASSSSSSAAATATATTAAGSKFCGECGAARASPTAKFCASCGNKF
eukprot:TRINITY_DN65753_c7_g4_i1.p1 TRINITY_DN65753_c7_g4~~TRINITY_DN65753_c7_g4_i1.p1  ORF type:complete len:388 (-),score=166.40 TRINITY_DN65753_c7_g4_i1:25-1188(-)